MTRLRDEALHQDVENRLFIKGVLQYAKKTSLSSSFYKKCLLAYMAWNSPGLDGVITIGQTSYIPMIKPPLLSPVLRSLLIPAIWFVFVKHNTRK